MKLCYVLVSLCLLVASPSMAAPLVYVEPPDLASNLAIPTPLGDLDLGTNTVTGTVNSDYPASSFSCVGTGDTADAFSFQVPTGLEVTSISLVVTDWSAPSGWSARVRNFSGGTSINRFYGNVTYNNLINTGGNLGPGTYDLQIHHEPRETDNGECLGGQMTLSYVFVFEVQESAVPAVPTTWGRIKVLYGS